MVKAIHPKTKDMTDEGLQQWRDPKFALFNGTRKSADRCEHGVLFEEFCVVCRDEVFESRLKAYEDRLETVEQATLTLLKSHYKYVWYLAQEGGPMERFHRAEIERIEPILLKLKEMVVTPC